MPPSELDQLRAHIDTINQELLNALNRRAQLVQQIQRLKRSLGLDPYDPAREQAMLSALCAQNPGPLAERELRQVFSTIFGLAPALCDTDQLPSVSRIQHPEDLCIKVGELEIGPQPLLIAGPCAIESPEQLELVAQFLSQSGIRMLRGGAFKPRSSPYAFQGHGKQALEWLKASAQKHRLVSVSEITDPRQLEMMEEYVDVLQVGARNMANYELLKELAKSSKVVLLKRGIAASLDEFLGAAEYLASTGKRSIILCERGIRSFSKDTRFSLDISAIPLLRQRTYLPVFVDVSHAAGRTDILAPLARAALAAGAQGLMVELHPQPAAARSDAFQQLDFEQFSTFLQDIGLQRKR
ncbi:MAG: bifunctional 3-deoxy-7-phosphoheptulonate synthase/chorismate mutase [Myxococcota bacterium]|jgi:3-deoxy-7-phosphoheptulonate synthase/chorismate mutase|nr:bifunctional 3-deoxy-7-phosphoheptulonate synthase/chorismate mutase [Myxococcota bacterium]